MVPNRSDEVLVALCDECAHAGIDHGQLRQEAHGSEPPRYVPLFTNSPEVLLDMPLKPGTRFLAQYPFQFDGAESPRGRELLRDISAADVIVEDSQRLKLNRDLEARIESIVRTSFVLEFDWSHFHFYRRRDSSPPSSV
jgi:hypothetical protein